MPAIGEHGDRGRAIWEGVIDLYPVVEIQLGTTDGNEGGPVREYLRGAGELGGPIEGEAIRCGLM